MRAPTQAQVTTAPAFSLQTLREVLAELKAAEPERGTRWDRAASIVALRTVEPGIRAGWWVESECEANQWYWVFRPAGAPAETCMCPDYKQRGGPCKHALAVRLFLAAIAREAERQADEPIPFPERCYSDEDRFELTPLGEAYLDAYAPGPVA